MPIEKFFFGGGLAHSMAKYFSSILRLLLLTPLKGIQLITFIINLIYNLAKKAFNVKLDMADLHTSTLTEGN
jgi:hypothetical protein